MATGGDDVKLNTSSLYHSPLLVHSNVSEGYFRHNSLLHPVWQSEPDPPYSVKLFIAVVALGFGCVGIIGNILVIMVFTRNRQLWRATNLFILNLAIGDVLLLVANVPILVGSSIRGRWIGGDEGCRFVAFCGGVFGFVSINTLTVLAVERCIVITNHLPSTYRISSGKAYAVACGIWTYSLLWSLPPYFGWGRHMLEGSRASCTFDYFTRTPNNRSYVIGILVFGFLIQLAVIAVAYIKIVRVVCVCNTGVTESTRNQTRNSEVTESTRNQIRNNRRSELLIRVYSNKRHLFKQKTTFTVFKLVLVFCVTWTPYAVVSLIGQFGNTSLVTPLMSALPGTFAKISSFLNPILYVLVHPKYRRILCSSNRCCTKKRQRPVNNDRQIKIRCTKKKHDALSDTISPNIG